MKKDSNHDIINLFISSKIKMLREEKKISQKELAQKFAQPISPQQMQKYESGANQMSAARLYEICEILNVQIKDFFTEYKASKDSKFKDVEPEEMMALNQFLLKLKSCDAADDFLNLIKKAG